MGFSQSAVAYGDAIASVGRADDRALVAMALAGNDVVALSAFDDVFNAGAGRDLIADAGGSDRINSGAGGDIVAAGQGNDLVLAGAGNDIVLSVSGNDTLRGDGGNDIIAGGSGDDRLNDGAGADLLVFAKGDGHNTVAGFNAADDQFAYVGSASGLANLQIRQQRSDTLISFADVSVLQLGVDRDSLHLSDFD